MLEGAITLKFYEVATGRTWSQKLAGNELCVLRKCTHHKVIEASEPNRLCIIPFPHFDVADMPSMSSEGICGGMISVAHD